MMLIATHAILKAFVRSAIKGSALLLESVLNAQLTASSARLMSVFAHSVKSVSPLSMVSVWSVTLAALSVIPPI